MATLAHAVRAGARLVAALALAAPLLGAQALHKDARHGFQFKPPKDFQAIALPPTSLFTVAKYQDETTEYGSGEFSGSGYNRTFQVLVVPLAFGLEDAPEQAPSAAPAGKAAPVDDKAFDAQVAKIVEAIYGYVDIEKSKTLSVAGAKGRELTLNDKQTPVKTYLAVLPQEDGLFLFEGQAIVNRYDKAAGEFAKAARSFKRIEKEDAAAREAELGQMDSQDRWLKEQIDKLPPGWDHLRTKRYLFLFDAEKTFVKQMADQIEGMRDVYETLYPPDKPIEAVSIVRVCKNRDEYMGYGGSAGSGGYWNPGQKELVFFDQSPRTETLCVLNHEAFHQFIYYFYGQLSPHSWYNEGHGDYFSGAKLTKSYRVQGFGSAPGGFDRSQFIKDMVRLARQGKKVSEGAAAPLKEFLDYSQAQYYDRGANRPVGFYPQGWAVVHMLRQGKGLDPKWQRILPEYLASLLAAREELAKELMEKEHANAEKNEKGSSDDMSHDPKDWFDQVDEDKAQKLAYQKTFKDWTDADWQKFDAFFWDYAERNL